MMMLKTKQDVLDRLSDDLKLRSLSPHTRDYYFRRARFFQDYFDKPATELGVCDIREYLLHLSEEKGLAVGTVNAYNAAIRFLFNVTLNRPMNTAMIPMKPVVRHIPDILTRDEVKAMFDACEGNLRDKCILMVTYSAGLRVSEIAKLRVKDIDSLKMQLFIEKGKGRKDRFAILAETTLDTLREFWRKHRPKDYLFISRNKRPMSTRAIQEVFHKYADRIGLTKNVTIHTLRHSFATHLLEDGVGIHKIKQLLGHKDIKSTYFYLRLLGIDELGVTSPLDKFVRDVGGDGDA